MRVGASRDGGAIILDAVSVQYREEPCRGALNRVTGMPFQWSLNPYMGCVHRCTFCYVRAFERRADRPSDDRYGQTIRVKVNVAAVLARELARASWKRELVAVGAATDPYQPAEGRYRLTRGCLEALARARNPLSLITFERLARDWPEELQRYQRLYPRAYLDTRDAEPIRAEVARLRAHYAIADRRGERLEPAPAPEQLSLAV